LASEIVEKLNESDRPVISTSVDHFHNPEKVRYAKGRDSAEGYYLDSFNYQAIKEMILDPFFVSS
jgi:uridine kinase